MFVGEKECAEYHTMCKRCFQASFIAGDATLRDEPSARGIGDGAVDTDVNAVARRSLGQAIFSELEIPAEFSKQNTSGYSDNSLPITPHHRCSNVVNGSVKLPVEAKRLGNDDFSQGCSQLTSVSSEHSAVRNSGVGTSPGSDTVSVTQALVDSDPLAPVAPAKFCSPSRISFPLNPRNQQDKLIEMRGQETDSSSESMSDDAFEIFLEKLRASKDTKMSRVSIDSFLTSSSDSSEESAPTNFSFYHRIDNARTITRDQDFKILPKVSGKIPPRRSRELPKCGVDVAHSIKKDQISKAVSEAPLKPRSDLVRLKQPANPPDSGLSRVSRLDFVYSLSPDLPSENRIFRHPSADRFIKHFKANREELANRLYRIFNETVFEKKLPEDLTIKWNPRLLKTAGQCKYLRREFIPVNGEKVVTRLAQIELSTKVCTSADRVRDTLIHEICHAAVWLIDGVNDGHGPRWRRWALHAKRVWTDLPLVSVCHAYTIETRFTYRCTGCGACVNRHSKSIDVTKQVCGRCRSRFELLLNTPRGRMLRPSVAGSMDRRLMAHCTANSSSSNHPKTTSFTGPVSNDEQTVRRPPVFADFVRKNYKQIRQKPEVKSHADAMAELGSLFKTMKVSQSLPKGDSS
ncbi:unnamed protein product [Calicophoron daubneyi]|uniref:SprT-like domain-containing protein n=1 Tax=Calicophoron daubneyi TaxID=300641 RepID=A0AAV2T8U3_CALDB